MEGRSAASARRKSPCIFRWARRAQGSCVPRTARPAKIQRDARSGQDQQDDAREQQDGAADEDGHAARTMEERFHAGIILQLWMAINKPESSYLSNMLAACETAVLSASSARRRSSTSLRQRSSRSRISASSPFPDGS